MTKYDRYTEMMEKLQKEQAHEKVRRLAMPVLGIGKFTWAGKEMTLNIVRIGKRDITMVSSDGTFVILNKKRVGITGVDNAQQLSGMRE